MVQFIIVAIETINQLNKVYLNQNRKIIKYCRFQFLSLSLNIRWIKWRKIWVSMYVKVLHSPIITFFWNFFSNELLNLYFITAITTDSVKTSLKHILQVYVFQGEAIQFQNFEAMQRKMHEPFQYSLSILSISLQYIPILSIYILHLFRALRILGKWGSKTN